MKLSLIKQAAVLGAAAFAFASTAVHADWTTFTAGQLNSFSFTHAHHPDGRFIFGKGGVIRIQNNFGVNAFTTVANPANESFDPAFIAVRGAASALIGGGGFPTNKALLPFDPSTPASAIGSALTPTNPQAYSGVWWAHPTSGRQGWLITGTNGLLSVNIIAFISADGSVTGPVTSGLSAFSGSIAAAPNGDVLTVLADFDPSVDNQVLRFTADQIDAAVAAIIATAPVPLAAAAATNPLRAEASSSLAVDSQGRLWMGGWQIPHLQLWDPASGITRRVSPLAISPVNHAGPPNYAAKAFTQGGTNRVSFLAHDSFYTDGSDLLLGHAITSDIKSRSIQFSSSALTVNEADGTLNISVTITPAPTVPVTVPVTITGTAVNGEDFTVSSSEIVCTSGTAEFLIQLTDDTIKAEPPETIILTLGRPAPHDEAGLGALGTNVMTITIEDNDVPPVIVRDQSFPAQIQVGAAFFHQVATTGPASPVTRWRATGLPPGLRIDPVTGVISGTPTSAGDYDRVLITATNAAGSTTSRVYLLGVAPLPAATVGSFTGFFDRSGSTTGGLGGRLDLVTSRNGAFTARVTVGRSRSITRGTLDSSTPDPGGTISVLDNPMVFSINAATGEIIGTSPVFIPGSQLTGWANRSLQERAGTCNFAAFTAGNPDALPQGSSHGSVKISARGSARIAVRTADGSRFTTSTALGIDGQLLVYQSLYRVPGTFCGILNIAADTAQTVSGELTWSKPAQTSGALYRDGWPAPITLASFGGRYRPVAGVTLPLDVFPSVGNNATLVLQDGGIEAFGNNSGVIEVRILSATRIISPAPLKLTVNNRTGIIGGRLPLTQGADKRTAIFSGLLIPTGEAEAPFATNGFGYFTLPTTTRGISRSGLLRLVPGIL